MLEQQKKEELQAVCTMRPGIEYQVGSVMLCRLDGERSRSFVVGEETPVDAELIRLQEVRSELARLMDPLQPLQQTLV